MNKKSITIISILVAIITILVITTGVLLIKWEPKHVCDCNTNDSSEKVNELVKVPYAKKALAEGTTITEEVIGFVDVNKDYLLDEDIDVIQNVNDLLGKHIKKGMTIPEGGLFFTSQLED